MADPRWLDEAEFGRRFVRRAVTIARIEAALADITAARFQLGPYASGPIGLARVAGDGRLGPAAITPRGDGSFAVTVAATLEFAVRIGAESRVGADAEVDLVLTPRPADPLLLVIEVARVRPGDVRIALRGRGLGGPVASLLNPLLDETRGYLAATVNGLVDSAEARRSRTIDLGPRIDGSPQTPAPPEWDWLDDAEFGVRLLRRAVTEQRLAGAFARLTGEPIEIGPLATGPGRVATVQAAGAVKSAAVSAARRPGVSFDAIVSLGLDLVVAVGKQHRYHADLTIPLRAIAQPADPLVVVIIIDPVSAGSVDATVTADGGAARLLGRLGNVTGQLRRQVARTVNARLADETGRTVDIGARIDATDRSGPPIRAAAGPRPRPYRG